MKEYEMVEKLIQELKELVQNPTEVFLRLKNDGRSVFDVLSDPLVHFAAIPAAAGFVGKVFVGQSKGLTEYEHVSFFSGLIWAVLLFILSIVGVYFLAFVVSRAAEQLYGKADETAAFKLVVYSYIPLFALGIFSILPALSGLYILGLYGIYLFYVGSQILLECPEEKALTLTVISSLAGILTAVLTQRIAVSLVF
ncbi:MAG: YIP1 family protein [candidate division KSB1 bacterium]|nr:YIP1 family protein [candidate division KSB1 bacterium]